ncbi:hypothetical protein [Nocardia sp. NBC_00403]|uniref:hypothetical protein n=1 Tax=Nocardia sp. NBC_00403 TaxID=2975990 RepID=UPI002E1EE860
MQSDFVRWCRIRAKIAYADNEYEMASMMDKANHIEEHWAHGPHAAKWFRLQGRKPRYIAHVSCDACDAGRGIVTVETHPATDLAEALAWSLFRLQHAADDHVRFSINLTGFENPICSAEGPLSDVVGQVLQWQSGGETRVA